MAPAPPTHPFPVLHIDRFPSRLGCHKGRTGDSCELRLGGATAAFDQQTDRVRALGDAQQLDPQGHPHQRPSSGDVEELLGVAGGQHLWGELGELHHHEHAGEAETNEEEGQGGVHAVVDVGLVEGDGGHEEAGRANGGETGDGIGVRCKGTGGETASDINRHSSISSHQASTDQTSHQSSLILHSSSHFTPPVDSPQWHHNHLAPQQEFRHAVDLAGQNIVDRRTVPHFYYLLPREMTRANDGDFQTFAEEHDSVDEDDEDEEEGRVEGQGGVAGEEIV